MVAGDNGADQGRCRFNWAARKLLKRFLQLGANEIYRYGEGDQRHDEGCVSLFFFYAATLTSADLCF